jgi:hypothetical protein
VKEQRSVINALKSIKKHKTSVKRKPVKMGSFKTELTKKMRMNFSEEENKQVLECLDLERNAAILDKTDCRKIEG